MKDERGASPIRSLQLFAALAVTLAAVAAAAPMPWWPTDRDIYLRVGAEFLIPGCTDFHCFRVLVPWVVERFPGDSLMRWKAYAVVCQAGAGTLMALLVARLGSSPRVAYQIACLTALGPGALYTLFDPHSADPLMHLLTPLVALLVIAERVGLAAGVAAVGIFAKEVVVVPLVVFGLARALQQRNREALRMLGLAAAVTALWLAWQLSLRFGLGYTSGATRSAEFHLGSYISFWLLQISPALAFASVLMSLGALWVLWGAGLVWGNRELRQLAFAAAPVILVFCAVQQPERALWNFAFLFMPAAAVILGKVPSVLGWATVAAAAAVSLRVGAQLPVVPSARVTLALSLLLTCVAIATIKFPVRSRVLA
jgi:hypothetical protein